MKIKTNLDWMLARYLYDIGSALSYGESFGVTGLYEMRFCNNDFISGSPLNSAGKENTNPNEERISYLKEHFCEECVFKSQCKKANETKDPKEFNYLGADKDYWAVQLHEWPVAKIKNTLRFAYGVTIRKGSLVKVIEEQKTDLLTKDENGNKVPIEFYYIIRYKDDLYSVMKRDIEFKDEYKNVVI